MGMTQIQLIWLIVFVAMLVAELISMGLTTLWFAGGALVALGLSFTRADLRLQIAAFFIVSAVLLFLVRPWARKHFNHDRVKTNAQSLVGETAVVLEGIDNLLGKGRVVIRGQEWMARSVEDGMLIPENARVQVEEISGVKLIVRLV